MKESGYLGNVIKDVDLDMESGCYEVKRQVRSAEYLGPMMIRSG